MYVDGFETHMLIMLEFDVHHAAGGWRKYLPILNRRADAERCPGVRKRMFVFGVVFGVHF